MQSKIELHAHHFSKQLSTFNSVVGYDRIQKAIERTNQKLSVAKNYKNLFRNKYFFHVNYRDIIKRQRLGLEPKWDDTYSIRSASLIASFNAVYERLSSKGKERIIREFLERLAPDRDVRTFEHELRCATHFIQNGYEIDFADLSGESRHDLIIRKDGIEFDVECKTISDEAGTGITSDQIIEIFKSIVSIFQAQKDNIEPYFVNIEFTQKINLMHFKKHTSLESLSEPAIGVHVSSQIRPEWKLDPRELDKIRKNNEDHMLIHIHRNIPLVVQVKVKNRPELATTITNAINKASKQCSRLRPALIWVHLLGLSEGEFDKLSRSDSGDIFGQLTFKALRPAADRPKTHVRIVRFSADGDSISRRLSAAPFQGLRTTFSNDGPAYDIRIEHCLYSDARLDA